LIEIKSCVKIVLFYRGVRKRDILPCDILNFDLINLNDDFLKISKHHSRVHLILDTYLLIMVCREYKYDGTLINWQ